MGKNETMGLKKEIVVNNLIWKSIEKQRNKWNMEMPFCPEKHARRDAFFVRFPLFKAVDSSCRGLLVEFQL
jgi:hypothetical protein